MEPFEEKVLARDQRLPVKKNEGMDKCDDGGDSGGTSVSHNFVEEGGKETKNIPASLSRMIWA